MNARIMCTDENVVCVCVCVCVCELDKINGICAYCLCDAPESEAPWYEEVLLVLLFLGPRTPGGFFSPPGAWWYYCTSTRRDTCTHVAVRCTCMRHVRAPAMAICSCAEPTCEAPGGLQRADLAGGICVPPLGLLDSHFYPHGRM